MNPLVLRKSRIVLSLLFLFSIAVSFLDLTGNVSTKVSGYPAWLQFIPSAVKFLTVLNITSTGFIVVLLLTILGGRVYCSTICPMGTIQDIFSRLHLRINKKKKHKMRKDYKWLRYSLLGLSVVLFLIGNIILLDILDPFSNTGKIFHNLLRPAAIYVNNLTAMLLNKANIYFLYPVQVKGFSFTAVIISAVIFLIIAYMSYTRGRLFCNTICPVGSLLGLVSKYSLYRISINKPACISCNLCEQVCKAGCIDKKGKQVDNNRCIACFNCLQVCPSSGITYGHKYTDPDNIKFDKKKRELITKTLMFAAVSTGTLFSQIKIIPKRLSKIPIVKKNPVSPPGSLSIEHFKENCTACHLCVSACPAQVIQPSLFEYGLTGILQPHMDYSSYYCTQDCIVCGYTCPSGAILPFTKEDKKYVQIGKVNFVKENCIVETEGTECGACSEHCPTKAVTMVSYKKLHLPEVDNQYCIGCGACEHACPVKPYKAIYVDGNYVHQRAKIKVQQKLEEKIDYKEEFPF